ncbi:S8 family serine peptidase [Microbacterium sp. ASV81]|uniref:S8 family serine peptidase n=1 Tax=Microbacterium capsulatum TaxID=3041921 RepID=A0ABU0XJM0_9MICO|nr:S8 family serine peptidase [Microbacterium sp. ASV81]MDQ4213890.1 S8 family serine peptidase [Microbacterium sp. ASV81]
MARDGDEGQDGRDERPPRPRLTWQERERATRRRGIVLDTSLQPPGGEAHATVYEQDVLLAHFDPSGPKNARADAVRRLEALARGLGWTVALEPLEDDGPEPVRARPPRNRSEARRAPGSGRVRRNPGVARSMRIRIAVAEEAARDEPTRRPDAWRLLVAARGGGITGFSLNHVLGVHPFTGNPFTGNPFTGNPFTGNPFTGNPAGIASYAVPGFGGRQPVAYTGPAPERAPLAEGARRPVVAILDTGCGAHPWFENLPGAAPAADPVLLVQTGPHGEPLGLSDPATDPEAHPSLGGPLDGNIDPVAGHGTFIAGLVRQACPEAQILPIRVSDGSGVILESDLLGALGRVVALLEKEALHLDVMNLSFGFYHESPGAAATETELYDLLRRVRACGCVVVCSAGNDATERPAAPAALYDWGPDSGIAPGSEAGLAPQIVVGALNPSGRSVALFSNIGEWVQTYVIGVSVLSTLPVSFDGGVQAGMRDDADDRRRETLDPDDFAGGFAVWSGTSFAAPVVAGRIAHALGSAGPSVRGPEGVPDAVQGVLDRCAHEDGSHI